MKVLVTGGTSGLGLAMASALAATGATVALTGRSGERAESVAAGLPGATGVEMDVRDESSVARAVDRAWSRLGGIDMLVNNAGIGMRTVNPRFMTQPQGFWEVPSDAFRAVIDTNLTGYFLVAREITPRMLASGGGRIVNISINHSTMRRAGFVPYGPSRAGSEALSRIMAADLRGTGVTVDLRRRPRRTEKVPHHCCYVQRPALHAAASAGPEVVAQVGEDRSSLVDGGIPGGEELGVGLLPLPAYPLLVFDVGLVGRLSAADIDAGEDACDAEYTAGNGRDDGGPCFVHAHILP
ncbi:SDR family oxidoreductase [Streptomyces sp. NPDC001835]|uniref:SDR family NAD(P)-dependent oxidoreductase n=1 Tax=Streptomyces sp. NPDC001835 TaxID=3154528 RepID=UPI003317A968